MAEGMAIAALREDTGHGYVFWVILAVMLLIGIYQIYTYKSLTEKDVIKGVLTDKSEEQIRATTRYYLHLSGNSEGIRVGQQDYERLRFGEIIEIETITGSFSTDGNINVLGKI